MLVDEEVGVRKVRARWRADIIFESGFGVRTLFLAVEGDMAGGLGNMNLEIFLLSYQIQEWTPLSPSLRVWLWLWLARSNFAHRVGNNISFCDDKMGEQRQLKASSMTVSLADKNWVTLDYMNGRGGQGSLSKRLRCS
jgi:hypothetical protein